MQRNKEYTIGDQSPIQFQKFKFKNTKIKRTKKLKRREYSKSGL